MHRTVHLTNDTLSFLEEGNLIGTIPSKVLFVQPTQRYSLIAVRTWTTCKGSNLWLQDTIAMIERRHDLINSRFFRPIEV